MLAGALFLAFVVVRIAIVQSYTSSDPSNVARVWSSHPAFILESGLAEIGAQATAGKPVDQMLVNRLLAASAKAPLAPEPFLVRGVEADLAGDDQLALQAFLAARERNPRTIAARYFLADHYLRAGKIGPGLTEISILARLVPQSLPNVAPFLAAYAKSPGAAPQVKNVLRSHPQLEPVLLDTLSADAANLNLILAIWSGRGGEQSKRWQERLLRQLVESRQYNRARHSWALFTGISVGSDQLYDPEFTTQTLPPFGWSLASGASGVAEPETGGRMHAQFYGRDDVVLASQLLTLKPGRYRLSMNANITPLASKSLGWTIECLPTSTQLGIIPLDRAGTVATSFTVPSANCDAQRLQLRGTAPEIPEQTNATIGQLRLQREAG